MEETQMEKDNAGLQRTILKAIRNAPIEFHDPLMTQKSFDAVEILGSLEKAQILRRTDSDPGPTCSAKSGEDEEEKETGENGEGRDEEKANEVQKDLICIISEKDASKAEKTKKDEPKEAKADDEDSQKTLLRAVCKDDVKTVQQILKKEPNLVDSTMPYDHNYTPLHYAAKGGHRRVAQVLLASGVNIYAKTTFKYTAHHLAAMADDLEMLDILDAFLEEDQPRVLPRDLSGKTYEDYLENSDRLHLYKSQLSLCASSPSPLPSKDSLALLDASFSRFDTVRRTVGKFFTREGTPTKK